MAANWRLLHRKAGAFWRSEEGSYTIEFVIWFPIFVVVLALMANVSMYFFNESQILRVVQDGNRAYAQGRLLSEADNVAYVTQKLGYLNLSPTITSVETGGVIRTTVSFPATQLMGFRMLDTYFGSTQGHVVADQVVEY